MEGGGGVNTTHVKRTEKRWSLLDTMQFNLEIMKGQATDKVCSL